ncbi:hypothetical protein [Micavibrio aeruginosavorus]|uniref:hypothetical protein n=1 Tax=Micavibrio aeruginosavorus TaxID=349221 RepID=UPI003F4ACE7F
MNRLFNAIHQFNCLSGMNRMYAASAMTNNDTDEFVRLMNVAHQCGRVRSVVTPKMVEAFTMRLAQDVAAMLSTPVVSEAAQKSLSQFIDVCQMTRGQGPLQLGISGRAMAAVVQAVLQHNRVGDLVRLRLSVDGNDILGTFVDFAIREDGPTLMGENAMKAYRDRLAAARAVVLSRQGAAPSRG